MNDPEADHGVSDAERNFLGELTGSPGGDAKRSPGKHPEELRTPTTRVSAQGGDVPRSGPLTEPETAVRRSVQAESERIAREELPGMFPPRGDESSGVGREPVREESDTPGDASGISRIGTHALEALAYPARRLGPGVVTGLGLAGVILLMALLVAILIRILGAS